MSENVLKAVGGELVSAGLSYKFGEWSSDVVYPYWIGEYQEIEPMNESGMQETAFLLTGFARGKDSYKRLEQDKEKIKTLFNPFGGNIVTSDDGSVVAIFYGSALGNLPTGDAELKKIQINLTVKEWSVN